MEPPRGIILNISPDDAARGDVTGVLRTRGFEVLEAASPAEAQAGAIGLTPTLIVFGLARDAADAGALRSLEREPAWADVPVLLTAAQSIGADDMSYRLPARADGYLMRPFAP